MARGAAEARAQIAAGRIIAAVLSLQGRWRVVGEIGATLPVAVGDAASRPRARCGLAARARAPPAERRKDSHALSRQRRRPRGRRPQARLAVEDVWHDNGPRLAQPLRRGSLAAVLRNPYAGRYVADIQPMMEALKPLGREMAARLVEALGGAGTRSRPTARAR